MRKPALLEEAGERGKIKSTAASSWWRVSMGARVIEKTQREYRIFAAKRIQDFFLSRLDFENKLLDGVPNCEQFTSQDI